MRCDLVTMIFQATIVVRQPNRLLTDFVTKLLVEFVADTFDSDASFTNDRISMTVEVVSVLFSRPQ